MFGYIVKAADGGSIINGFEGPTWVNVTNPGGIFDNVISATIAVLTVIAGIWFLILVITGGIEIMTAQDNKGGVENARKKIITGLIGLVFVIAGLFVADLVGTLLGIELREPGNTLMNISP